MDISGSKILVIGGAGLVGSHLVDQLILEDVEEVIVFDNFVRGTRENLESAMKSSKTRIIEGDMTNLSELKNALKDIDFVYLLAALWLLQCAENPREGLEVNVVGTYNALEACVEAEVQKLIFSSSASVYGDALFTPMTEEHPLNNRTFYGATKVAGEQFLRAFNEMYGLDYIALRYMNIYGPRQDYEGAYVSVIMKVLDRIDAGLSPIIFGDGTQSYDFVYVEDVAKANICALKSDVTDDVFNIGTGVKTSINELVHLLLELTDSSLKPEYRPQDQTFVTDRVGSTEKAEKLLGFRAKVQLKEGFEKLIKWRKKQIAKGVN